MMRGASSMNPIGPEGDIYLQPTSMEPLTEKSSDEEEIDRQRAQALTVVG